MKDRDDRLGDNRPAGPRVLSGITKAHLAELVFDCYGVRIRHIRKVYSHIKGLPAIVGELIEDEFLREVGRDALSGRRNAKARLRKGWQLHS